MKGMARKVFVCPVDPDEGVSVIYWPNGNTSEDYVLHANRSYEINRGGSLCATGDCWLICEEGEVDVRLPWGTASLGGNAGKNAVRSKGKTSIRG